MDQTSIIEELLGVLNKLTEEKGVPKDKELLDKNVSKNGSSTLDSNGQASPTLRGNERRRITEISTLFAKVFLEQQKKNAPDTKPKTLISEANKKATPPKIPQKQEKGSFGSVMALLVGGVALVAAAIPAIIASLFQKVGPLADSLKILGKAGLIGGLKVLAKGMSKLFGITVLKRIPIVGSLINFWFAYKEFKAGRYVPGIMELAAGIVNFVPGVGTALSIGIDVLKTFMDSKGMFDEGGSLSNGNAWNTIKGWGSSIGNYLWENALWIPVLGGIKRFSMAKDAFSSGNIKEGFYQLGTGLLSLGAAPLVRGLEVMMGFLGDKKEEGKGLSPDNSWSGRLKGWIKEKLKHLPYVIRKPLEWFGIVDDSGESTLSWDGIADGAKKGFDGVKSFIGSAWDNMKGPLKDNIDIVTSFAKDTWEKTKNFATNAWDKMKEEGPKIWSSIQTISSNALEKINQMGTVFSESIQKLIDTSMKIFKGISEKVGNWVGDFFGAEVKSQSKKQVQSQEKEKIFANKEFEMTISLLKASNTQNKWLGLLYDSAKEQVRLLGALVNVGTQSYQELKRISGNSNKGAGVNIMAPSPTQKTPMVPVTDNRMGYAGSPYALGS